jgi:hypothetical protein
MNPELKIPTSDRTSTSEHNRVLVPDEVTSRGSNTSSNTSSNTNSKRGNNMAFNKKTGEYVQINPKDLEHARNVVDPSPITNPSHGAVHALQLFILNVIKNPKQNALSLGFYSFAFFSAIFFTLHFLSASVQVIAGKDLDVKASNTDFTNPKSAGRYFGAKLTGAIKPVGESAIKSGATTLVEFTEGDGNLEIESADLKKSDNEPGVTEINWNE